MQELMKEVSKQYENIVSLKEENIDSAIQTITENNLVD